MLLQKPPRKEIFRQLFRRLAHPLLDPVALLIDKAMIECGIATRGNLTKEE